MSFYIFVFLLTVSSKPLNLTVLGVNSDAISLRWTEPERANGAINGYRIYFMYANYTDVRNIKISKGSQYIPYTLTNLS